ncbi:MAG: TatD family hydrolase, partial [Sphaerochaetaceae bacterium]|nr:TatD family hydrolase [Sphaerochaetaceae bacterium]
MTYSNIIDSHFHTQNILEKGVDVSSVFNDLFSQGFKGGIDIGCTSNDLPQRKKILEPFPSIYLSGAMGPWESRLEVDLDKELSVLKNNIITYKVKAIGEIGLDYYWDYGTRERQAYLFRTQIAMAQKLNLPVIIHCRDASSDTVKIIKEMPLKKRSIIHCFNGDHDLLNGALSEGYFISFAGNITYKNAQNLRDIVKKVPLNSLLLETDSPYLTPVPYRGQTNNPLYIIKTYQCLSDVLNLSIERVIEIIFENYT